MVDRLRNSEANSRRIANVEACFGSSGSPLGNLNRVLVGEGVLVKMCRKKPKPRQFFLFNDLLVYGSIILSKKRYNKQHLIPLEEVKLENLENVGDSKNGWLIKTRTKSFAVYAATEGEKHEWMLHIERCVQDLLNKCQPRITQPSGFLTEKRPNACVVKPPTSPSSKDGITAGHVEACRVCDTCYNKLCNGVNTLPSSITSDTTLDLDSSDNSDEEDITQPTGDSYQTAPTFYGTNGQQKTKGLTIE
uniref:PH domain-containing protein n=1 Tax=Ditylenchus dipsaci TaxID=166011 RepID=A0A915DPE8_9BILA